MMSRALSSTSHRALIFAALLLAPLGPAALLVDIAIAPFVEIAAEGTAQASAAGGLLLFGVSSAVRQGSTFDDNFATGQYYKSPALTNTRASTATCLSSTGVLIQVGVNQNCIAPGVGLGSWEARTNYWLDNQGQGAVAGSPGTLPTNWGISNTSGLTQTISIIPNGIAFNYSGTATSTTKVTILQVSSSVASYGQSWTGSSLLSLSNVLVLPAITLELDELTSGTFNSGATSSNLSVTGTQAQFSLSKTFTTASSNQARLEIKASVVSGQTYNFTISIVAPQIELNPNLNSSLASATINSGGTLYTPSSSGIVTWAGTGCSVLPTISVTTSVAGAVASVTGTTPGVCTTFPPAGATTWSDGTGLGTGSGASFNLIPINNAALAFATPPTLTSGTAATRAADNITAPVPACATFSMADSATTYNPTNTFPGAWALSDGTSNNDILDYVSIGGGGYSQVQGNVGGSSLGTSTANGSASLGTNFNSAFGIDASGSVAYTHNILFSSPLSGPAASNMTTLNLASLQGGSFPLNGYLSRLTYYCGKKLSAAALKALAP